MEEIGLKLKEKREENGVSIEEAADDLNMRPGLLEDLESGKKDSFLDVNTLKNYIRDYAKYLGLNSDELIDEFNEFLFDFTSKIPAADMEKARLERENERKEFASPYTKKDDTKSKYKVFIYVAIVIVVALIVGYFALSGVKRNDFHDNNVTYVIRR